MMQAKKVKVEATNTADGSIDFDIDGVKAKHSRIKLDKDSGAHAIDFELKDRTGRGLRFDQGDPLWVGEDCPCPPPAGVNSDQLGIAECVADRLSTVNENSGRSRELRYQLNFVAADGSRAICDPVITNGGGTRL
jgi:hypothetical protein